MNEDFEREHIGTGSDELDWRLQTYVAARLTPSSDSVRRMRRTAVTRAADLAAIRTFEAERLAAEAARTEQQHRGLFDFLGLRARRRAAAAFLAASMVMGGTVGVLAASPSSPLYGARIWLETALLPASGDARSAAHVDRLEARVEDAEHAAGGGDPTGVAAALAAYRAEMQAAILDARGDPARLAALQHAIDVHLLLLEQLAEDAPADAQNAIHSAINDSRKATKDIDGAGKPTAAPTPPGEPSDGGGGANGEGSTPR